MVDEDDRREFIDSNLRVLTHSTVIGIDLVLCLKEKGLINGEEMDLLIDGSPSIKKATLLYTKIVSRWSQSQFEEFKTSLQDNGYLRALEVFTNAGADLFLTNDQVQLLKEQRSNSEYGCYEGLSREDEDNARFIVECTRGELMFKNGRFKLQEGFDRKKLIPQVKHFLETLKNRVIWWNPRKPSLPSNYVVRRIRHLNESEDNDATTTWEEVTKGENTLVILVDPPGMGKSSEVTHLEQQLRKKVPSNRIIIRVNLNEVQKTLSNLSPNESASIVFLKIAPFLPENILQTVGLRVFVLLDGLDEVCPRHKDRMVSLLHILSKSDNALCVLLTTRPHLKETMEREFSLKSWSLLTLTEDEQDEFMKSVLGVSSKQLIGIRDNLTSNLLGNPLMLSMFVDVIKSGRIISGGAMNTFDLFTRFVESKHKLHLEKGGLGAEDNFTKTLMDGMLARNLPYYHRLAIRELIDDKYLIKCDRVLKKCDRSVVASKIEPSGVTRDELLSVGFLVEGNKTQLVFQHQTFAEFFFARLMSKEEALPTKVRDTLLDCIQRQNKDTLVEETGDEYIAEFISKNLMDLVKSTVISPELGFILMSSGVLNESERYGFMDERTTNIKKAIQLYTKTARKWSSTQFEAFKRILQDTGNYRALEIFRNFNSTESNASKNLVHKNKDQAPNRLKNVESFVEAAAAAVPSAASSSASSRQNSSGSYLRDN